VDKQTLATMAGGAADCYHLIAFLKSHIPRSCGNSGNSPTSSLLASLLSSSLYSRRSPSGRNDLSVGTMITSIESLPYHTAALHDGFYNSVEPVEPPNSVEPPPLDPAGSYTVPTIRYVDDTGANERVTCICVGSGGETATAVLAAGVRALNEKNKRAADGECERNKGYRLGRSAVAVVATHKEAQSLCKAAVVQATRRDGYSGGIVQVYQIRTVTVGGIEEGRWRRVSVEDAGRRREGGWRGEEGERREDVRP